MNQRTEDLKDGNRELMSEENFKSVTETKRQLIPPTWLDISLRLARPAFFSHMAIIIWYNAQVSEPFQFLSDAWVSFEFSFWSTTKWHKEILQLSILSCYSQLYHMTMTFAWILTGAILFQICVFGPMTRAFEVLRKNIQ